MRHLTGPRINLGPRDIAALGAFSRERAKDLHADAIVMTEKDSVRFSKRVGIQSKPCPVYYLKVAIKIRSGEEDFTHCISRICYP